MIDWTGVSTLELQTIRCNSEASVAHEKAAARILLDAADAHEGSSRDAILEAAKLREIVASDFECIEISIDNELARRNRD